MRRANIWYARNKSCPLSLSPSSSVGKENVSQIAVLSDVSYESTLRRAPSLKQHTRKKKERGAH